MATERRRSLPAVSEQLFAEARQFDFFQAVRLLLGHRSPPGYDHAPDEEAVRFRVHQTLGFPVTDVESILPCAPGTAGGPAAGKSASPQMTVNFMGLTGPNGVLPRHYNLLVMSQIREGWHALPEFLDLFNHRTISLFYRAWEKYRASILIERNRRDPDAPEPDPFTLAMLCFVGLGTGGLRGRMAVPDDEFLYYAGNFSRQPPNPFSLQAMLRGFLRTAVAVRQFQGRWLTLPVEDRSRLPGSADVPDLTCQLGRGAVAGNRVWDVQSKFRIRVGPIGYALFCRLMPSGDRLLPLCQFVRTYVGPEWDYDVQLVLLGPEVPWAALDGKARLGWNTWVRCKPFQRDVDDVVFSLPKV